MNCTDELKIVSATSGRHFDEGRKLLVAYRNAVSFDAGFENFRTELASFETRCAA